jgi:hypothetical protein
VAPEPDKDPLLQPVEVPERVRLEVVKPETASEKVKVYLICLEE